MCGLVWSKAKANVGAYLNKHLVGELIYSKLFIFLHATPIFHEYIQIE